MSVSISFLVTNKVWTATLLNGGGGAPAIDEDAEFPLSNLKLIPRTRFWRSSTAPASPLNVDVDTLSGALAKTAVGVAMLRAYRGAAGVSNVEVSSSTTYNPATWVSRWNQAVVSGDNNLFNILSPTISDRYWRFAFTNAGQFSCRIWIVMTSDLFTLAEGAAGSIEEVRRIRTQERKTLLGNVIFNDLGNFPGGRLRHFVVRHNAVTISQINDALYVGHKHSIFYRHHEGTFHEVIPVEPAQSWMREEAATDRFEVDTQFEELP